MSIATDDLAGMFKRLTRAQQAAIIEQSTPAEAKMLSELLHTTSTQYATPLDLLSGLYENFVSRPHLDYLSERLTKAVEKVEGGQSHFISVSLPPRAGKSTLISTGLPVWCLARQPSWKIGLLSNAKQLAVSWGRDVRRYVTENPQLGVEVAKDAGAVTDWQTTRRGGVTSRSVGQPVVGLGFKIMILDDVVKDYQTAHSFAHREAVWNWYSADARSRIEEPALVASVGCLTHDVRVRFASGKEVPISEVEPGDVLLAYRDGKLVPARVLRWANVGPDNVYTISMASGRQVRANDKHPFLVGAQNGEAWKRTDELVPGDAILATPLGVAAWVRSVVKKGVRSLLQVDGSVQHITDRCAEHVQVRRIVQQKDANIPSTSKDSAPPTTVKLAGRQDLTATHPSETVKRITDTVMELTRKITTASLTNRAGFVLSAKNLPEKPIRLGDQVCSWITVTTGNVFEAFSVTIATFWSGVTRLWSACYALSNTYGLTTDRVVDVALTGYEDVYDIEVEGTHTFLAEGLVTHNTRWHTDDFIGRLLSDEYAGDPEDWEVINLPAIATVTDVLGREEGDPLFTPFMTSTDPKDAVEYWRKIKASVGEYIWSALYQGSPTPAKGQVFDADTFQYYLQKDLPTAFEKRWTSWDAAFKGTITSDYVVGQYWGLANGVAYLLGQVRGKWTFTQTISKMRYMIEPLGVPALEQVANAVGNPVGTWADASQHLVEDAANGPAIIDTLGQVVQGLRAVKPDGDKVARARAVTPLFEAGKVRFPSPEEQPWISGLVSELKAFPSGKNDDQVDCLTQGLRQVRIKRPGGTSVVKTWLHKRLPGM